MPVPAGFPRGRNAWTVYALTTAILALSSAAPFARLGTGAPRLDSGDVVATTVYLGSWVPFLVLARWLVRDWTTRSSMAVHVLLVLTIPAAHTIAFRLIVDAIAGIPSNVPDFLRSPGFQVLTLLGTLQYLVLLAVAVAVVAGRAADRDRERSTALEEERSQLTDRLAAARLDALTSQLRPHFLFNTLNSISVLARTEPTAAQAMIRHLSTLLRAVLETDSSPTVRLSEELRILDAYLEIQRARFSDRLDVELRMDVTAKDCIVPALILQPLVENAVDHGIAHRSEGGRITIAASRNNGRLTITVSDNGSGRENGAARREGIGLSNTRARLLHLYGPAHRFDIDCVPHRGCTVTLELPAQVAETVERV